MVPAREHVFQKETSHASASFSDHHAERLELRQGWAGPPQQELLSFHTSKPPARSQQMDLVGWSLAS